MNEGPYNSIAYKYYGNQLKYIEDLKREAKETLLPFLDLLGDNSKITDLGCGTGLDLEVISECRKGSKLYGMDISVNMIEICKKRIIDVELINDDFLKYEFKEQFDGIIMKAFIHLFPKSVFEKVILTKIKKILKTRGYALLSTSIHSQSSEGIETKSEYPGIKRYRARYKEDELLRIVSKKFEIVNTKREKDIEKTINPKTWLYLTIKSK